jgi:hypothetical protein
MSTAGSRQPLLRRGLTRGLAVIGAKLSDLKQSVRVEIGGHTAHHPKTFKDVRERPLRR